MRSTNIQGQRFKPIGKCIYCGSDGGVGGLRTEHIIPYSLGGNAELPESSCRACEAITSYLDGYLARHVFGDHRVHSNVQTRNRHPEQLSASFEVDGTAITPKLPISKHPYFTVVPALPRPGILEGRELGELPPLKFHMFYDYPDELHSILGVKREAEIKLLHNGSINLPTFARAIAKIAYCNWVASRGTNALRHLAIKEVILGRYAHPTHFVGSRPEKPPPPEPGTLHTVEFGTEKIGRMKLEIAHVRLFANRGTETEGLPIYEVVLGALPMTSNNQK